MADGTYQPKTYRKQGGDEFVVASGGTITVESGGAVAIESGGTLTNAGTVAHTGTQTFDDIVGGDPILEITGQAPATVTSAGGAVAVAGAIGGATSGAGGAATLIGGVGTAGNSAGGVSAAAGGAGQGSAAGGVASQTGGAGGATGAGGASTVTGGAGGATSGTGGAGSVTGGAGTAGNANGGRASIQGGAAHGTGVDGSTLIGGVVVKDQATPTAETTAATLTIAELLTGIITGTHAAGATQAYTLPTGTLSDAGVDIDADQSFEWSLINLSAAAADTITVTAGAGHTIVGNPIVQSAHVSTGGIYGSSGLFRSRKTAANTFVTYRIA